MTTKINTRALLYDIISKKGEAKKEAKHLAEDKDFWSETTSRPALSCNMKLLRSLRR